MCWASHNGFLMAARYPVATVCRAILGTVAEKAASAGAAISLGDSMVCCKARCRQRSWASPCSADCAAFVMTVLGPQGERRQIQIRNRPLRAAPFTVPEPAR